MSDHSYKGILPAMQVPFKADYSIDEPELRRFTAWLAGTRGITGLVTNGHTGEVFALNAEERAEVTRIVAEEAKGRIPVVSGICVEGIGEACEHALLAKKAGASALLIMPPHQWLRFGMRPEHVVEHFTEIGKASGLDLVVHVYPSWTRAAYSCDLLAQLARLPWVKAFKVGTRDMNKYPMDISAIREAAPEKAVLTCHDEYLLASMVQGVDGALVGFASFIPQKIVALWDAVQAGDLKRLNWGQTAELWYRLQLGDLQGFKEIRMVTGYHFGLASEEVDTYFAYETARFAREIVFNRPPNDNRKQTTYAREVCDAEPVLMDPTTQSIIAVQSETIQAANRKVDDFITQWVKRERHRFGE